MTATFEQRVAELKEFEREEGLPLPLYPWRIVELEDSGFVVDLVTGEIANAIIATPTASAKAVLHLLAGVEGDFFPT